MLHFFDHFYMFDKYAKKLRRTPYGSKVVPGSARALASGALKCKRGVEQYGSEKVQICTLAHSHFFCSVCGERQHVAQDAPLLREKKARTTPTHLLHT